MKFRFIPVAVLVFLSGRAPAQVVAPMNPVVQAGQTLQFTADRPVQWSLLPGSAGIMDPGGLYHAPASIAAPMSMGGCQIGAPDSVFNTRIDSLPLNANNAVWMAALPSTGIGLTPSWGTNVVDHTTPAQVMNFYYTPAYNGQMWQIPEWPSLKRESGVFSDPLTGVDRHVLTVNQETCRVYDLYNNYSPGTNTSNLQANAQSGWQYDSMSYVLPTAGATDAAGMPLAPTTLTLDDIRSGTIRHAMRVTFANGYIAPSSVWPATTHAGAYGVVPYGTRFRLKAGFDISGFSPTAQIILTGLKQYGMIISDGGTNWDIVTSTDLTEDRAVQAAILEIQNKNYPINSGQFEIVDESPLMVSPSSSQVAYNNGYVTPAAFAIVKADDGADPPVTFPIALRGVALNSPDGGGVWIQSGVSKTLKVFGGRARRGGERHSQSPDAISGLESHGDAGSSTRTAWTMKPRLGELDPVSGSYTAPRVNAPTTTSITATSVADPAVSVTFPLTVLPAGPIRIDAGDATANPAAPHASAPDYGPDSQGNMWWRDQAVERGWGVQNDYWYPGQWPSMPDIYLYQTQWYNQSDTVYRFLVPNGNYNIDYYVAQGGCDSTNTADPLIYREHLESQGQIAAYDFRPLALTGGACYTPVHTTIPAEVTDNNLYFALRRITDHAQSGPDQFPVTIVSAFTIARASEAPHLTIDPATPPALGSSGSIQFYAVGWFMSNEVKWTLESGPGTLDASGLYTAPAGSVGGTAVVKATSTTDRGRTATVKIDLNAGSTIAPSNSSAIH